MTGDPLLDHLEKTFADAYRKEIDQEENVWRSLPFFAATLALQLAALAQVREWIGGVEGWRLWAALGLLALAGAATLAALAFLCLSVWPADFQYVAREPAFREYAEEVRIRAAETAGPGANGATVAEAALRTVKAALAEQYATATDNNRRINQGRARWRTRAGLATMASVLVVLVLVAAVVITNLHGHARQFGPIRIVSDPAPAGTGPVEHPGPAATEQRPAAADGGGAPGLVERPGDRAPGGGAGAGRR